MLIARWFESHHMRCAPELLSIDWQPMPGKKVYIASIMTVTELKGSWPSLPAATQRKPLFTACLVFPVDWAKDLVGTAGDRTKKVELKTYDFGGEKTDQSRVAGKGPLPGGFTRFLADPRPARLAVPSPMPNSLPTAAQEKP
jgi:hypothetical protein